MVRKTIRKTLKFKGKQLYAVFKNGKRISGNFETKAKAKKAILGDTPIIRFRKKFR